MLFNTLMGALVVKSFGERPKSFSEHAPSLGRAVLLFPSDAADFEAVMLSERREVMSSPIETSIVLSRYFRLKGVPQEALSVVVSSERFEIPIFTECADKSIEYPIKCKQIYTKCAVFSGGMEHTLFTEGGRGRARIIEAPSEIDFSGELLRRLSVVEGLEDTVRSVAFRFTGGEYRMASTDSTLSLDSVVPLAGLAAHLGVRGRILIVCREKRFSFRIADGGGLLYVRDADIFPPPLDVRGDM